ncbi:MarR family transcriptional regulator, partial [Vibrio vulnificus]
KVAASSAVNTEISLTPKQQQVLDIVAANAEGINPKSIGLAAGQEDAKAASWATGALKKLLEDNLVQKEQLAGNKVIYKLA